MTRLPVLFATCVIAFASIATVQPGSDNAGPNGAKPGVEGPDAQALLAAALKAHRGDRPPIPPKSVWFRGSVTHVSPQGDRQEFAIEQWFTRDAGPSDGASKAVESIATRLAPKGIDEVSISGFDGKHYYVRPDRKRKIIIDHNTDYKQDLERIKGDLLRTRFIVDTFLVGHLLRPDATVRYVERSHGHGLESHVIDHTIGASRVRYYVNAKQGEKPYFLGIEFPKTDNQPKQNLCFRLDCMQTFDGVRFPQQMEVFEDDGAKPTYTLWIRNLEIDRPNAPAWSRGRA